MNSTPTEWLRKKLGEVAVIVMGQSPPSSTYNDGGKGLPFFQGKAEFTELHPVARKWCTEPKRVAEPNDILISVRAPVGATNIADLKCCIGRGLAAIRYPSEHRFVFYYLRLMERTLDEKGTGTTFRAISGDVLRELDFPLPPLPEQHRIVEKIEALFSELDKGVEQLKTAAQQLKVYRQSVLKWAFEGKLTEEWRKSGGAHGSTFSVEDTVGTHGRVSLRDDAMRMAAEPTTEYTVGADGRPPHEGARGAPLRTAHELLSRIKHEREAQAKATGKKLKPIAPLTEKELAELPSLPERWAWVKLGQAANVQVGFAFKSAEFKNGGIRLLRGENIEPGKLRWTDTRYWNPEDVEQYRGLLLNENDIILAMDRPVVSSGLKIALVRKSDLPALLVQRVARIGYVEYLYLFFCINSQQFINHCLGKQTGTQLPHISGSQIESFVFPLPPPDEQHQIVQEIESRLSVCDKLEETIAASLQQSEGLRQSILKKAFEGKLVPQDPSDEPASVLLDRIRREQAPEERDVYSKIKPRKRTSPKVAT